MVILWRNVPHGNSILQNLTDFKKINFLLEISVGMYYNIGKTL